MIDLTFKIEKTKQGIRWLRFLPKSFRPIGMASLILNALSIFISLFFYVGLQKEIPLFYSLSNDQQLADKKFLFLLPLLATAINVCHFLIAYLKKEIDHNILKMFLQITMILELLVFAILLRVIIIVY